MIFGNNTPQIILLDEFLIEPILRWLKSLSESGLGFKIEENLN